MGSIVSFYALFIRDLAGEGNGPLQLASWPISGCCFLEIRALEYCPGGSYRPPLVGWVFVMRVGIHLYLAFANLIWINVESILLRMSCLRFE